MSKRLIEMTAEDFEQSKVWEYHGDSDANARVGPSLRTEIVEDDGNVYLASTEFRLADGTILRGFTSPTDDSGLGYVQPVIFNAGRQFSLWSVNGSLDVAREFGKATQDVYPIYWKADVLVDGETRSGYITL